MNEYTDTTYNNMSLKEKHNKNTLAALMNSPSPSPDHSRSLSHTLPQSETKGDALAPGADRKKKMKIHTF